jgi:photosystem II stability/assembly factor-like uncharacterized protein
MKPLMNRSRQVTGPDRGTRAWRGCRAGGPAAVIPALAALAVAGLLGGCAVPSSSAQHAGSGTGPAPAAGCAGAGSGGTGPGAAPLQAIQFADGGHGWAAGAGRILATSDGGRTWTRQYAGPAVLSQLDFTSTADGWAVGQGALLRTTNGGASWTALSEPRLNGHCLSVSAVHFVLPVLGYAIAGTTGSGNTGAGTPTAGATTAASAGGVGGQLLRTTDGGVTWQPAPGAPDGAQAVCFSTRQDGYLGVPGRIWRTTDAGATWSPAFTEPPASPAPAGQQAGRAVGDTPELGCAAHGAAWALFLGSGTAMMHAPYLAYATQDGASWHGVLEEPMLESAIRPKLHLPAGPGSEPGPFSVISSGAAAFVGYTPPANGWGAAPLVLATDGGAVLKSAGDIPAINEPLAAAFLTPAQGWVVGANLKAHTFSIEATTDAGRSWSTQYTTG